MERRVRNELQKLLDGIEDSGELIVSEQTDSGKRYGCCRELFAAWHLARKEANSAFERWREGLGPYIAYRAAEDRADAAQDALQQASGGRAVVA